MTRSLSTILAAVCLTLSACASSEKTAPPRTSEAAAMGILNDYCPIMGEQVDTRVTTDFKGHTIGFCCAGCINTWNELPDENKKKFVKEQPGN